MKTIKSETLLHPLPSGNYVYDPNNKRYIVLPIQTHLVKPKGRNFSLKSRSYVFVVSNEDDQWVDVKFDSNQINIPLTFTIPQRFLDAQKPYSILIGYNDGFLGGSFRPGFYNNKEKIQFWYCLAKLDLSIPTVRYLVKGNYVPSIIIDMSDYLPPPGVVKWVYYKIGDPSLKIGYPIRIGEKHDST